VRPRNLYEGGRVGNGDLPTTWPNIPLPQMPPGTPVTQPTYAPPLSPPIYEVPTSKAPPSSEAPRGSRSSSHQPQILASLNGVAAGGGSASGPPALAFTGVDQPVGPTIAVGASAVAWRWAARGIEDTQAAYRHG
jgi:hypothetical protein